MPSGRIPSLSFEYVILTLLLPGPSHGYELFKEMEAWPGLVEVWKLKQSMLYADLNKLEKLGYVASMPPDMQFAPPRVNYEITEKGKMALQDWLKTPVSRPREIRPEFLTKLLVAARFGREYTQELIKLQKIKVQAWIQSDNAATKPNENLTAEERIISGFRAHWLQHVAVWLDSCQSELDKRS